MEHNRGRAWLYDEAVLRAVMSAQPIYIADRVYIGKDGKYTRLCGHSPWWQRSYGTPTQVSHYAYGPYGAATIHLSHIMITGRYLP